MAKSRGLGRGLDTLFVEQTGFSGEDSGISTIRLSEIEPNLSQPRKEFEETAPVEPVDPATEDGDTT